MKYILMACMMTLAAAPGLAQEEAFTAKLFKSKGKVECLKEGTSKWVEVKAPYMLEAGDQVKTGPKARAEIYIKYGSKIRLGAETTFIVNTVAPEGNVVQVLRGKMHAWVRKFAGRSFTVRTPAAVCAVRGTVFGVEVSPAGGAVWDLFAGSIQVADNRNNTVDLVPGQRLAVSASAPAGAPPPVPVAIPAEVKPPAAPAVIKEEKLEIKAEAVVTKAAQPARPEPVITPVPKAEEQQPVVQEPPVTVIPTQTVQEGDELSPSTPR